MATYGQQQAAKAATGSDHGDVVTEWAKHRLPYTGPELDFEIPAHLEYAEKPVYQLPYLGYTSVITVQKSRTWKTVITVNMIKHDVMYWSHASEQNLSAANWEKLQSLTNAEIEFVPIIMALVEKEDSFIQAHIKEYGLDRKYPRSRELKGDQKSAFLIGPEEKDGL